jgi:hypothetical protein
VGLIFSPKALPIPSPKQKRDPLLIDFDWIRTANPRSTFPCGREQEISAIKP